MKSSYLLRTSRQDRARVLALAKPYRGRIGLLSVTSFLTGVTEASLLVVVTRAALAVAEGEESVRIVSGIDGSIGGALILAVLLAGLRLLFAATSAVLSTQLRASIASDLRAQLATAFLSTSWNTQQNEPSGHLLQLVTGFVPQAIGVITALTLAVNMSLNLFAMILIAIFVDPLASLVVLLALIVLGSLLSPIRARVRSRAQLNSESQKSYAWSVSELGDMGLEMQTFGVNRKFSDRIQDLSNTVARSENRVNVLVSMMPILYSALAHIAIVVGVSVASLVGVSELSTVGAVMLIMLRSLFYGQQFQNASSQLAGSVPFLEDIDSARDRYVLDAATQGLLDVPATLPIRVENVSFSYSVDRPALTDVSFTIEPGEVVGIIGPSGSGKSTLVQLLLGLREPTSGSIRIADIALRDIDRSAWTRVVSFVPQDPHLFTGTVAQNIRFFRDDLDDGAVERAARQANVLADVQALPRGFDTDIGQRGVQLSGGQRQRLSIARALVGEPRLLILDEPTSALDVHSEFMIRQTIGRLRGGVTVLVIAHRLSTLETCDRLMVIESGRLMAFDTPENLRINSEFYRQVLALSGIT